MIYIEEAIDDLTDGHTVGVDGALTNAELLLQEILSDEDGKHTSSPAIDEKTIDAITSGGGALVHVVIEGRRQHWQIWTCRPQDLQEIARIVKIAIETKRSFTTDDRTRTVKYDFDRSGYGTHQILIGKTV